MFLKKSECFSSKGKYKNFTLQDSELCSTKAGWPSYKLQLDVTNLTKTCREQVEYEDFKCQEMVRLENDFKGLFGLG
jgi:hypothetical protein